LNYFTLAWKNLLRRQGRTSLTVLGIAIAIAVLFSLLSFNSGYEKQLTNELNNLGIHILAVPKGCPYEAASLIIHGGVIPKYLAETDVGEVKKIAHVEIASPVLLQQFYKDGTPHIVYGIKASEMTRLKSWWKVEGRFFSDDESGVMVIGRELAEKEKLKVGDILPFGPAQTLFTIVGILERTDSQDDNFHFLPLEVAQELFQKQGQVTAIAIKVTDVSKIFDVATKLEEIPDIQAVTTSQILGTIMNIVGSVRTLLFSVIIVAVVISAVGITNTLLMSVGERVSEFGMMKAIGASGTDIAKLVILETLLISIVGGVLGLTVATAGSSVIEEFVKKVIPYAPAGKLLSFQPQFAGLCFLFSLVIGIVCAIYPAAKSSRLSPLEAIRSYINE